MKLFPRIYSLSTIGLIHHQEFDYKFHGFRTDFIGESGSGKSLIADLIQLILVGSEAFESATRGTDIRDPEGMVLRSDHRSSGLGYAFLNVEMAPGKYLVVGTYLETGNRNAQAFIVQKGYLWPNIEYLSAPIFFTTFLKEDEILPVDALADWLDHQGFHIKSWQRYKEFHKILFKEKIVPLDLASSDRLLKDYAEILQSFSRGKMLDTSNSESLKLFLFGNQETKRIMENYRSAEKDMESAIGEYGSNLREIERVTQKQKALSDLKLLKDDRDRALNTWLLQHLLFRYQETCKFQRDIKQCVDNYHDAVRHKSVISILLNNEIRDLTACNEELFNKQKITQEEFDEVSPLNKQLIDISDWMNKLNCSFQELSIKYNAYKSDQTSLSILKPFLILLKQKNIEKEFSSLPFSKTPLEFMKYLSYNLAEKLEEIRQKELLLKFVNIDNPESLGTWAINQNRAFTIEEESAIIHFQNLSRKKQVDFQDYLPDPAELILSLSIVEREADGFWININGIRRYIEFVVEQILNTTDGDKIRSYFALHSNNLEKDIIAAKKQFATYQNIQDILNNYDNVAQIMSAFDRREHLLQHEEIPSLNISEERFKEYQDLYQQKTSISKKFADAKRNKTGIDIELKSKESTLRAYHLINTSINEIEKPQTEVQSLLNKFQRKISQDEPNDFEKDGFIETLNHSKNKIDFFENEWKLVEEKLSIASKLPTINNDLENSIDELQKAKEEYLTIFESLPKILISEDQIPYPQLEYNAYFELNIKYSTKYQNLIENYIPSEAYRLANSDNFIELAKNLLPEAFHNAISTNSEENAIDKISSYLIRINEKNRQLNSRKIQKIKTLLDEVDEIMTLQENTVRRIDNYLKSGAQITGGYSARLRKTAAGNYPRSWMSMFKDMVEDEQLSAGLQNGSGKKYDLHELMKNAFIKCGGPIHASAKPIDLLDPSNYYTLSFKMESESGRVNKGSTGQTYAAIALLCIARLSIMSHEEGKSIDPAVRIMPIDEAEGLGSNYDMLYDIAQKYDYQLISLSIGPVGKFVDGEQFLYMLHKNMEVEQPVNYTPVAILCDADRDGRTDI